MPDRENHALSVPSAELPEVEGKLVVKIGIPIVACQGRQACVIAHSRMLTHDSSMAALGLQTRMIEHALLRGSDLLDMQASSGTS